MGNEGEVQQWASLFYMRGNVLMSEPVEVRVARLEEKMQFLVDESKEAKIARKAQYEVLETLGRSMQSMATEVTDVKTKLAGQAPTIEEFITIKHKVVGAGKLGKWVWVALGGVITFVYNSREAIIAWLAKG